MTDATHIEFCMQCCTSNNPFPTTAEVPRDGGEFVFKLFNFFQQQLDDLVMQGVIRT